MESFAERLRAAIEKTGLTQKDFAIKAGINKRALDMYLGKQGSMPPADVAVKIAESLATTVEYLVTGKTCAESTSTINATYSSVIADLDALPEDVRASIINTIHTVTRQK